MKYAFTRSKRLLTPKDYENVFMQSRKQGVKIDMPGFFVLVILNDKNTARIGFALSKKSMPKAHSRNRMKRLFRESFRHQSNQLKNMDIVVLARSDLSSRSNKEMQENLTLLWQKINKIYPPLELLC